MYIYVHIQIGIHITIYIYTPICMFELIYIFCCVRKMYVRTDIHIYIYIYVYVFAEHRSDIYICGGCILADCFAQLVEELL